MAKTNTDRIDELSQLTATITERIDSVRRDVEAINARGQKMDDALNEVKRNLSIIEERLNEMKRVGEEGGRRHWAIVPSLIGALLGGVLTFLGQLAIRRCTPEPLRPRGHGDTGTSGSDLVPGFFGAISPSGGSARGGRRLASPRPRSSRTRRQVRRGRVWAANPYAKGADPGRLEEGRRLRQPRTRVDRPLSPPTPPTGRSQSGPGDPPPLRNAVTPLMKGVGYGRGYRNVHDDPAARGEMPCLPERFAGRDHLHEGSPDAAGQARAIVDVVESAHEEGSASLSEPSA